MQHDFESNFSTFILFVTWFYFLRFVFLWIYLFIYTVNTCQNQTIITHKFKVGKRKEKNKKIDKTKSVIENV